MVPLTVLLSAFVLAGVGAWLVRLGDRFGRGDFPSRNRVFGSRTPATLASDAAWAAGQRASASPYRRTGRCFVASAAAGLAVGLVTAAVLDAEAGALAGGIVMTGGVLLGLAVLVAAIPSINRAARAADGSSPGEGQVGDAAR